MITSAITNNLSIMFVRTADTPECTYTARHAPCRRPDTKPPADDGPREVFDSSDSSGTLAPVAVWVRAMPLPCTADDVIDRGVAWYPAEFGTDFGG